MVQPQEGGVDLLLRDLGDRAVILAPIMISAHPIYFLGGSGSLEDGTTRAADNFLRKWAVALFCCDFFRSTFEKLSGGEICLSVNNGGMTACSVILIFLAVIDFFRIYRELQGQP